MAEVPISALVGRMVEVNRSFIARMKTVRDARITFEADVANWSWTFGISGR